MKSCRTLYKFIVCCVDLVHIVSLCPLKAAHSLFTALSLSLSLSSAMPVGVIPRHVVNIAAFNSFAVIVADCCALLLLCWCCRCRCCCCCCGTDMPRDCMINYMVKSISQIIWSFLFACALRYTTCSKSRRKGRFTFILSGLYKPLACLMWTEKRTQYEHILICQISQKSLMNLHRSS